MAIPTPVEYPASWRNPESLGYGTYPGPYKFQLLERYKGAVPGALVHGYRHIDTAQAYENEVYIGERIRSTKRVRYSLL
jgi:diketogulonate reductase-like aldo/keto reductase